MVRSQSANTRITLAIIFMLATSPLAITCVEVTDEELSLDEISIFEGEADYTEYASGDAYNTGIILFDVKTVKFGWDLEPKGETHHTMYGAAESNLEYKVILSGNMVQAGDGNLANYLVHVIFKNPESGSMSVF